MLILWEDVLPGLSCGVDLELDEIVSAALVARGALSGIDNLTARPTVFRYAGGDVREDLRADGSGSTARNRSVVCGISTALFGHPLMPLPGIAEHVRERGLRVYLAESTTALAGCLRASLGAEHLVLSEYLGEALRSGDRLDGVLHEDLMETSFADGEFDLVVTSEVLEHVPDAPRAEKEIARILRRGGSYVFTVPFDTQSDEDTVLAERASDGRLIVHGDPVYHGDPLRPEGILAYRIFTAPDLKQRFAAAQCALSTYRFWSKELGLLGLWHLVNVARKRA